MFYIDIAYFIITISVISLPVILFLKRKTYVQIYFISLLFLSLITLIHHYFSVELGRNGFSILTKELLKDEIIYHNNAILLSQFSSFNSILNTQMILVGYVSYKSIFYSIILAPFYYFIANKIIVAKAVTVVFSSLIPVIIFNILNKFIENKKILYIGSLSVLIYPNFIIHSIQLEKDIFVLMLLFITLALMLNNYLYKKKKNRAIITSITLYLFILRPQYGLFVIFIYFLAKFSKILLFKKNIFLNVLVFIFFSPFPILFFKYFLPELFSYIDAHKAYSVFAGHVGYLIHDYSNYWKILGTLLESIYYFILGPISPLLSDANFFWKILIIEPIMFCILPCLFIFFSNKKFNKNLKQLFILIIVATLFYVYLSVIFESHFSSYLRKRMPVYLIFLILFFIVTFGKKMRSNN